MRNLLILSALLAAATRPAPACGFYSPRVYIITEHFIPGEAVRERSFALTDRRDVPADGWSLLAARSYDPTQIADAPASPPMTLTLLGDGAPTTITTTKRVFLKHELDRHDPMGGYEIATGGKHFAIAVSGSHVDMSFAKLESATWTADDEKWLADNKIPWTAAEVEHLGNLDTFSAYIDGETQTVVRREGVLLGQFAGRPVGRLDADGQQFMLIEHDGSVRSIYI
jgi:hypothetical protein